MFNINTPTTRNIRLRIAYDGTEYAGWQVQPNQVTIQGCVEAAIEKMTGERVRLLCAGRTDSGVHALGQVVNFPTTSRIPADKWRPALQTHLPPDIVILESDEVPADFHATFWAHSKRYRYVILNSVVDNPFMQRYSWRIGQELDVNAMQDAAQCLLGTHDFRSFESHWPNKATSVRTVMEITLQRRHASELFTPLSLQAQVNRPPAGDGEFICLEIEADGFLYNMVRTITGTLVYVGRGSWTREDVQRILKAQDRSVAGGTAPACGLFMVQVKYNDRDERGGPPAGLE
ncbi:tRNA pseudouridine(38-40) synthase TruA [Planctomicrobium sp. SH661]|uniref:tRNA pseudouridine(38-40) synthase TruA n=1 Tax=Planctomicrobium sp. SH661 TaxID=3448124 RepID=UPI003F5B02DF